MPRNSNQEEQSRAPGGAHAVDIPGDAQALIRAGEPVLTKDVLLENRRSESSHKDSIDVIFCRDGEQVSLPATMAKSSDDV